MKKLLFLLIAGAIFSCKNETKQEAYTITGNITGAKDGMIVKLKSSDQGLMSAVFSKAIDSTVIKDGKFEFTGTLDYARLMSVSIEKEEDQNDPETYHPAIPVFMGNETVLVSGVLDSLSDQRTFFSEGGYNYDKVNIEGSNSHKTYMTYLNGIDKFAKEQDKVLMDILKWYGYNEDGTKGEKGSISEGIEITKRRNKVSKERMGFVFNFIKENATNEIGLNLAYNSVGRLNVSQIDELLSLIPEDKKALDYGKKIVKKANEHRLVAEGANYVDLPFKDTEGNPMKLSDYVGKGKYVLLEFWASWCGPCRADIPHLKEVYELYHPEGFEIISVSMDEKHDKWIDAVEEEQMNWLQVSDGEAFEGSLAKIYKIGGIPTCVLVDPNGKIVTRNMRGSEMDRRLIEMYGNKFGENF